MWMQYVIAAVVLVIVALRLVAHRFDRPTRSTRRHGTTFD